MRETRNTQKKRNTRSIVIVGLLLLLVAVIGFGGYTLSKYVTKKSGDGSATVAKWGFTVDANASELFGKQYSKGVIVEAGTDGIDVSASTENNLVAPGTTGSMTFSIKGSAEVLAQIKIEFAKESDVVLKYTKGDTAGEDYAPVKWTLTKKGQTDALVSGGTLNAVATALNAVNDTFKPNETVDAEYTLSWAWAFSISDENDALDTLLGMYVADDNKAKTEGTVLDTNTYKAVDGTVTKIAFHFNISITQLQYA